MHSANLEGNAAAFFVVAIDLGEAPGREDCFLRENRRSYGPDVDWDIAVIFYHGSSEMLDAVGCGNWCCGRL